VRRFNWFLYNKNSEFDYHMNDDLGRMVLILMLTFVPSYGKMFYVYSNDTGDYLNAKREEKWLMEFKLHVQMLVLMEQWLLGMLMIKSEIKKLADDERMYHLLEHVGTKPNVIYHVKVRNT
jgi:molybdopterin-containing oxidoreductase family iron-sulfur binding subunit